MESESQVNLLLETLFSKEETDVPTINTRPSHSAEAYTIHPEELLHATKNGNKYYLALQSFTRQFVDDSNNGSGVESPGNNTASVVQFSSSKLNALSRQKVRSWDDKDHEKNIDSAIDKNLPSMGISGHTQASSLFAWSSGDRYIAARKRELQRRNFNAIKTDKSTDISAEKQAADPKADPKVDPKANSIADLKAGTASSVKNPSKDSLSRSRRSNLRHRLTSVVERESNRFIQDRIDRIKAHHLEQATKKVDERRRKEHEIQLRRVQLKEEKYEKILKAAIALQNTKRNSGFFGSLFGPKPVSNSFTLEISDTDVHARPAQTTQPPQKGGELTPVPNSRSNSSTPIPRSLSSTPVSKQLGRERRADHQSRFQKESHGTLNVPNALSRASTPGVPTPENLASEILEPYVLTPKISEPNVLTPKISEPNVLAPKVSEPNVLAPKVSEPGILAPEILEPERLAPEVSILETQTHSPSVSTRSSQSSLEFEDFQSSTNNTAPSVEKGNGFDEDPKSMDTSAKEPTQSESKTDNIFISGPGARFASEPSTDTTPDLLSL